MILSPLILFALVDHGHAERVCPSNTTVKLLKTIDLPSTVSYFMRVAPETREVSFAVGDDKPSQLLNLDTGKITPVDGSIDPVVSPDGKILVISQNVIFDGNTGKYEMEAKGKDDLKNGYIIGTDAVEQVVAGKSRRLAKKPTQIARKNNKLQINSTMVLYTRDKDGKPSVGYVDEQNRGTYQTIGVWRKTARETQYRMVYQAGNQISFQQYAVTQGSSKIVPVGKSRPLCDLKQFAALPMLSHDGSHFSYFDTEHQQTVIMAIGEGGPCRKVGAIDGVVGKPDFSPDNQSLVFHREGGTRENPEFDRPEANQKLTIHTYDLKSKRSTDLVTDVGVFSYYPVFLSDHEIAYIEATGVGDQQRMRIKIMNISRSEGCGPIVKDASSQEPTSSAK